MIRDTEMRKLRHIPLPGCHRYRLTRFGNHYGLEVWLFGFRLNFKAEWSGQKTTHFWRIRQWGWRTWVENCVVHFRDGDGSFAHPGPDRGEVIVARVALFLGWKEAA